MAYAAFRVRLILCVALAVAAPVGVAAVVPASLQQAIAGAAAGATIDVPPGVHHVHLTLAKPITLAGQPGAVLDGGGTGTVLRILASHVAVRGLTIRHSGADLTTEDSGIYVAPKVEDVTLVHNRLEDVLFGVYLDGPSRVLVKDNTIIGMRQLRSPNRGDGIHLWNDTRCVISGNDVSHTRDGIYVYVSPGNLIEGNTIHDVRYGVHYMYSQPDTLRGNVSFHNVAGFALMASNHLTVTDNRAYDNASYGMLLNYVNYSLVKGNLIGDTKGQFRPDGQVVPGAAGKAIFVYLSNGNVFTQNLIADSRIGIHITAGSVDNRVYDNAFVRNRTQVFYVQNVEEDWSWKGRGNYWSDYDGWNFNGDGIGVVPYRPNDGVDVLMWKYPDAKLLLSSPAILLMRYVQRAFPVFAPGGLVDNHPLMQLPAVWRKAGHG
ncbi:MAG: nitrous oxide reductase family maturation protein NosD [Rhodanobacteraceae bacterium]|nr:MAG: nitrous oxide reductase family maturation protein NosD [Rhodanobacteraceae bacterium]